MEIPMAHRDYRWGTSQVEDWVFGGSGLNKVNFYFLCSNCLSIRTSTERNVAFQANNGYHPGYSVTIPHHFGAGKGYLGILWWMAWSVPPT